MRRIKNLALFLFIISLTAGDNFYERNGLTQGMFLIPLLLLYISNPQHLPPFKSLNWAAVIFILIITIQLIYYKLSGIAEWYRSTGGVVLTFMIIVLFFKDNRNERQLKWLSYCTAFPVAAFYLGYWQYAGHGFYSRQTFLSHDPNHLAHFLIYGIISLLYLLRKTNNDRTKIVLILILVLYFPPLIFTFSRTSILVFFVILVINFIIFLNRKYRTIFYGILFTIMTLVFMQPKFDVFYTNPIVSVYFNRFSQVDETRQKFYKTGVDLMTKNFVTGIGIKDFRDEHWRVKQGFYRRVFTSHKTYFYSTAIHNGFIDIFLIGGIGYFLSFCIIILYPSFFIFFYGRKNRTENIKETKFLIYSLTITFVLVNLTYSLYHTKLGWWGIAFSYLLIAPYYLRSQCKVNANSLEDFEK